MRKNKKTDWVTKRVQSVLPVITLSAYSCFFVYFQNIGEGKFKEIIIPFLIFSGIGAGLQFLIRYPLKSDEKASVFSWLLLIMIINFNFVVVIARQKFGFSGRPLHLMFAWLAIYAIIFWAFIKMKTGEAWIYLCNIISVIYIGLIIFNGITAIPDVISWIKGQNVQMLELVETGNPGKMGRNVYYMIFDEYGGTQNLQYYYNFDNQEFEDYLDNRGFCYSHSSYNQEATLTIQIVPNLLNLDYVTSDDDNRNRAYMREPVLYRYFWNMGYKINLVNHQNFLAKEGCNSLLEKQKEVAVGADVNFTDYLIEQSIISSIFRNIGNYFQEQYANDLTEALKTMESSWKEANEDKTLTICYIQCPHIYFVYDENGNLLPKEQKSNWEDKDVYIGQLKYLNRWIQKTVDGIIDNDPDAVIILQSDHGARGAIPCENVPDELWDTGVDYRQNVLNCVYWGANVEPQDIEGLSGVNTLRLVLNTEFDSDFDMISIHDKEN